MAFLEGTSCFLRNSLFSAELHVRTIINFCIFTTADTIPKSSPPRPALSILQFTLLVSSSDFFFVMYITFRNVILVHMYT